ncbi:amino acid ABC transporter permease [Jatrophihabitans telluris]|uniref:Amino acid ABC transporter permease n=1 Tax=Jatrophihabitans telluris TaxID=2038343 RepID=A0ABY4R0D7_9ACTN|nr:amino acid ABC transporter permease [Jatrophihabitans telluris]UQX89053.1 amino acid ABC transporter permease [Jatrophihabitans telluris]
MSVNRVLFDAPGPRARRRIVYVTGGSVIVVLGVLGLALRQLDAHGQLAQYRWRPFLTTPYLRVIWQGLEGTLRATAMSAVLAFPLGIVLALLRLSPRRVVSWLATAYIEVFRSIPLLLLIYAFLLALPRYSINLPIFYKLVVPIVLVSSAVIAEVVRAGVKALDSGQGEAAVAIGLRYSQVMRLVVLPQSLRLVLPTLVAQLITLLKESTLGYAVSYPELMKQGDFLTARTHLLLQTYVIIAVIYVVINFLLGQLAAQVERRLRRRPGGSAFARTRELDPANPPGARLATTA